MIPTVLVLAFVAGFQKPKWLFASVPPIVALWVVILGAREVISTPSEAGGAALLGLANAVVGVSVSHFGLRRLIVYWNAKID